MLANRAATSSASARAGITNAGPDAHADRARSRRRCTFTNTLNWLKGAHSLSLGGELRASTMCGSTPTARDVPSITFGTPTGDPRSAMFTAANFPGSTATRPEQRAALYAVLVGRVSADRRDRAARPGTGQYVYQGDSRAEGRLRQIDLFVQDNWRVRPNLSLNPGVRYAVQPPFYALNNSYSIATLDDVWGISGYVPGLRPERADAGELQPLQAGRHDRASRRRSRISAKA